MDDKALRQHLIKYRLTGDPGRIAVVFEATAPQLWQLAMHLTRDPSDADDLLQSTYLALIQSVESYDETRPAIGWIVGILTNQARSQKRRAARWTDPDRLLENLPAGPAERAQTDEERTLVSDAIGSLPQLYRQVIELVLDKGIGPTEIAARLSRTPATVRVQLHRAVSMLRRGLPAGLALPVALISVQSIGLESVRRTIHKAALKQSTGIGTGAVTSKLAASILGLAALAAGTWAVLPVATSSAAPRPGDTSVVLPYLPADHAPALKSTPGNGSPARATSRTVPSDALKSAPVDSRPDVRDPIAPGSSGPQFVPARLRGDEAVDAMIPFATVIRVGDGFAFETQRVVERGGADLIFATSLGRVRALGETRLASLPDLGVGREWPDVSASALLFSIAEFDPELVHWVDELELDFRAPTTSVFLVRCESGYAVAALGNTWWMPGLNQAEAMLMGMFNPVAPTFSVPDASDETVPGLLRDLTAYRSDPLRDAIDAARRSQRAELDVAIRALDAISRLGQGSTHGILNHGHTRSVSDVGALAAATYRFEGGAGDGSRLKGDGGDLLVTMKDQLSLRLADDDRSLAWKIASFEADRQPLPQEMGAGLQRIEQPQEGDRYVVHTLDPQTDRWDFVEILEVQMGKWLVFACMPMDDPHWLKAYRAALASSLKRIELERIDVRIWTNSSADSPARVYLDEESGASVHLTTPETLPDLADLEALGYLWAEAAGDLETSDRPSGFASAHVDGGHVPPGNTFEIETIDWRVTTTGHASGDGALRIEVLGQEIAATQGARGLVTGTWTGSLRLGPGDTSRAFVELGNSSVCDVRFLGSWHEAPLAGSGTDR